MKKTTLLLSDKLIPTLVFLLLLFFVAPIQMIAQTQIAPQVNFLQRTSSATPTKTIYNVKGDFTMLGNTNLTLVNYTNSSDNETNSMKYIDIDGDANTWNSSMATLELSNSGENSANQNCSTIIFAGLYWTGKSDDADTFVVSKQVPNGTQAINNNLTINHAQAIANTNYSLNITRDNQGSTNRSPIYTFSGNGNTYTFHYSNNAAPATVRLSVNGGAFTNIPVTITISGTTATATLATPYVIVDGTVNLTINQLIRSTATNLNSPDTQTTSSAAVNVSGTIPAFATITKNYDKRVVSLKGPGATTYETITANTNGINSEIRFPGAAQSGIYVGYQEITDYVKAHGPGAYTVADIALTEGTNANPGLSGGWVIVVIYENPIMKSRAVTLFDGYDYINGQAVGGEYGLIPISGFTTVGSGQVNMKLGLLASEGDIALSGDYLAVQKLNQDPAVYPGNYSILNHAGNLTTNFFNSSIFPLPAVGSSNPILQNNTGVDFSMFTIPNASNSVIANNQTATTFRFGSTSDVFTIFGFAMSVDAYIPEPTGLISVTSINNVTNPAVLNALPGQTINYSLNITNQGTEATNNTIISIPIPATAIFNTGATISYHTYNGFTTTNVPYFDSATNQLIWDLGVLPITAGHPEYIYADLSFTLNVTTDCAIILSAGCSPEVSLETGTITGTGAISGTPFTEYFFQGYDATACHLPIDGSIKIAIDASSCFSSMAGPDKMAYCGGESTTLEASAGAAGSWEIVSGPAGGGEIFSDITSPTSTFFSPNLGAYTLRWATSCATDNVVITFSLCNVVNFDGVDDNINFKNNFNLNSGNFSIEAWVKSNATNADTQVILSKHLSPSSTDGYDLRLVNNLISFNWNNNSIIATHAIDTNRWYHIAVTFDGTNYKLYIDGILDNTTASVVNPTSNTVDFILGAMSQNTDTPYNYYNGYADELRMWNVSLTANQIRQMMNQEITNDGSGNVKGAIIPKNINGLSWTNLTGYYQMNKTSDVDNGYLVDKSGNLKNGKLKGIGVPEPDTAPIPYISVANGSWETDETWVNYPVWDVPNSIGVDGSTKIDWNIVKTLHDITSNGNKTVLGLLVNSNKLSAENNSKIEVSSYLKLDGKIDLVGMSQLVQTTESDLDPTSSGSIERDQQGQSNLYNYNYWSSPVGPINAVTNNNNYTVGGVLKDGTNPANPININWVGGYNGSPGTPISLARYWIFKFQNVSNAYANWSQVFETGTLAPAQGFTLKGSGAASGKQNYTFIGKPFNGTITSPVAANNLNLSGNPYASAIDANQFIDDNVSSLAGAYTTTGTIYYWEHSSSNNTHNLAAYQGGYAAYTKTGGTPPIAPSGINGLGGNIKIAKRFIPVGQSFFVVGSPTGGNIVFNNTQRLFVKEDDVEAFQLFRTSNNMLSTENNDNDAYEADTFSRVRLGFNSSNNYHRQILLGFMNQNATSGYDVGYDAIHIDNQPNDMYFMAETTKLTIQGVGSFNKNRIYPLEIKTAVQGNVKFVLDSLENFNANQQIYVYDEVTDIYHNITEQLFEVLLPAGIIKNRFYLCFKSKNNKNNNNKNTSDEGDLNDDLQVMYTHSNHVLNIINFSENTSVSAVSLFNIMGQFISKWDISNKEQTNIQIPIQNISSGTYIVKIKTTEGEISKKIIVK
ncbi:LamG-like jellyroll fold domain-containing protein [Flavobacterium sp.]|uniref:LamG-like jellyroll fold domain-containing protein n=1 Tax=Flavobacterium sp. TaxID=239 RepID=UPI002B4B371C|nr:LamG-like jellyroll fold domain-containing protein [Flavobacterium sp.]HLF51898.1 LamG-like jellyroll fold domain-containing protein [Flavobacterium sp.]